MRLVAVVGDAGACLHTATERAKITIPNVVFEDAATRAMLLLECREEALSMTHVFALECAELRRTLALINHTNVASAHAAVMKTEIVNRLKSELENARDNVHSLQAALTEKELVNDRLAKDLLECRSARALREVVSTAEIHRLTAEKHRLELTR